MNGKTLRATTRKRAPSREALAFGVTAMLTTSCMMPVGLLPCFIGVVF
jgi:hypothetical protein